MKPTLNGPHIKRTPCIKRTPASVSSAFFLSYFSVKPTCFKLTALLTGHYRGSRECLLKTGFIIVQNHEGKREEMGTDERSGEGTRETKPAIKEQGWLRMEKINFRSLIRLSFSRCTNFDLAH